VELIHKDNRSWPALMQYPSIVLGDAESISMQSETEAILDKLFRSKKYHKASQMNTVKNKDKTSKLHKDHGRIVHPQWRNEIPINGIDSETKLRA